MYAVKVAAAAAAPAMDNSMFEDAGGDMTSFAADACSVTAGTPADSGASKSALTAAMAVEGPATPGTSSAVKN